MSAQPELAVWVVEDNRMLRQGLAELLREQPGMSCPLAVGSCEDFLAAIDAGDVPDVVLMDIGLPGASGIEGIRHLRTQSPASKVLVLTIHAEDEKVFEAICAGANGYLLKPTPPERVVEAVREIDRGAAPINAYIASKMLTRFAQLPPPKTSADDYGLTAREREILQLLVDGLTLKAIAGRLGLSYHTISNHLRNVYGKLHVRSRTSAVAKALREDLL